MSEKVDTIPAGFKLGATYAVELSSDCKGEKLTEDTILLATNYSIVVEIQNDMKFVDAMFQKGHDPFTATREEKEQSRPESIDRFAFHPQDARFLCVSLIHTLAAGGDRVAAKLDEALLKIMDERE